MLKPELQDIVDTLCADGCQEVNRRIAAIEAGNLPVAMQRLNSQEQQEVLRELKSIMAVYDRCNS